MSASSFAKNYSLKLYITKSCGEEADEKLGKDGKKYVLSCVAEQVQLGNVFVSQDGVQFVELPHKAKNRKLVAWIAELDQEDRGFVLVAIGSRQGINESRNQLAEVCGRFVGGVVGSLIG